MCSYFIHFRDDAESEAAARSRQLRYYRECVLPASPSDPVRTPPGYWCFLDLIGRVKSVQPQDLGANSVLLGSSAEITESLKKVEAAGAEEVILYFNVGLKDHQQTKDEMARFMAEVAPHFA